MSSTFRQQLDNDSQQQCQFDSHPVEEFPQTETQRMNISQNTLNDYCDQLWLQIKNIKKQIRKKIDRNQFIESMGTKLSISQISELGCILTTPITIQNKPQKQIKQKGREINSRIGHRGKQNNNSSEFQPFHIKKNQSKQTSSHDKMHFSHHKNVTRDIGPVLIKQANTVQTVPQIISNSSKMFIQNTIKRHTDKILLNIQSNYNEDLTGLSEKICRLERTLEQRTRISEDSHKIETRNNTNLIKLEAQIYNKAERSQIDKLFNLNQLLVIEIEQAKQIAQEVHKKVKNIEKDFQANKQLNESQISFGQQETMRRVTNLQQNLSEMNQLLHKKIEDIRKSLIANVTQRIEEICEDKIQQTNKKISKQLLNQDLQTRELLDRAYVFQTKQSQLSKITQQLQQLRCNQQKVKISMNEFQDKVQYSLQNNKLLCKKLIQSLDTQIKDKIQNKLGNACEQFNQQIVDILDKIVAKTEFDEQIMRQNEKMKRFQDNIIQCTKKIEVLYNKNGQIQEILDEQIEKNEQRITNLTEELKQKVSIQQIKYFIKNFVSCQEIKQIARQIDKKVYSQLQTITKQQSKINEVLCSQNIVGKWLWTTSVLKGGNLIEWDKELTNTLPQNFKWKSGETIIAIENSGYYKIELGFYSKKKPTVQIIVNGKTVISAVNSSSYVLHHSSGKLKDVATNGQVAGLTYIDYLLLKESSRVSVSYSGQYTGQGFIVIQRL